MATFTLADRVAETTTTTGTGTLDLGGAVSGVYQTFIAGCGNGAVVPYVIVHRTQSQWEVGRGVVTDAATDTLTRVEVFANSNGDTNPVNFLAGTKDVFLTVPADKWVAYNADSSAVTLSNIQAPSSTLDFGTDASGSNAAATNFTQVAPLSTGNATPAALVWQVGAVGASGSTPQTATEILRLRGSVGSATIGEMVVNGFATTRLIPGATQFVIRDSGNTADTFTINAAGTAITAPLATSITATSAALSVGSLTVDTNTLYVDAINNRVGIGTASPATRLHVASATYGEVARFYDPAGQGFSFTVDANTGFNRLSSTGNQPFLIAVGGSERARIDASGNVGIGVTPSAWESSYKVLQQPAGFVGSNSTSAQQVGQNARFDAGWFYVTTAEASLYSQSAGAHAWFTAPSGTAGNAITFTERARITAGGNFIPGANNAYSLGDGSTRWTEVFAINGTINTSDANAKTDVQEDVPGWEFVKALRPVHYVWKVRKREAVQVEDGTELVEIPAELDADGNEITPARTEERPKFRTEYVEHPGKRRHLGFIAQEVKEALGERDFGLFTQDAETGECGLRYDQFAAPFAKVLQEAMARIETLEARVAALDAK